MEKGFTKMGFIEIFEMNENGAGWVSLENASIEKKIDLEWAIMNKAEMQMLCFKCHTPIPKGNVCVAHKNVKGAIYFD